MAYALDCIFSKEDRQWRIATIYHDGNQIRFKIHCNSRDLPCSELRERDVCELLQKIISLPLLRNRLRSRALPYCFSAVEPHSFEHFKLIPQESGPFHFSHITECDTIPVEETVIA